MLVCQSVKKSVEKWLKTLNQRELNVKLEIKYKIKVMFALNLSIHLMEVYMSVGQLKPTTHILDHTYPELNVRL